MIEGVTDSWTASARETLTIDGMVKQIGQQDVKVRTASHWAGSGDGYNLHESLEHYVQYNVKRRPKLSTDMTERVYVFDPDIVWKSDKLRNYAKIPNAMVKTFCSDDKVNGGGKVTLALPNNENCQM
jgi:hypothetical protein